jgi:Rrf2 family protein
MFEISERAHAGLQLMATLASAYQKEERLSLKSFAEEAGISPSYLEEIATTLRKANLIEGRQGPGGGYCLTRPPKDITLEQIATALEGQVMLVECQKGASIACPQEKRCRTKSVWHGLQRLVQSHLKSTSLSDILSNSS